MRTTFDGAYLLTAKGTAGRPIVIESAGDGEVIFDGDGAFRLFDVMGVGLPHLRGAHDSEHRGGVLGRRQRRRGRRQGSPSGTAGSRTSGIGIDTQFAGSKDFYIADNVFIGRDDRYRVLGWANPGVYGAHPINSYYAIKVYGSGPRDRAQRRGVFP